MNRNPPSHWYAISHDNLAPGEIRPISFWGERMILQKTRMGIYVLRSRYCTHFGVDLAKGRVVNDQIECPFHGYRFDEDGSWPGELPPLRTFPVRTYLGIVWMFYGPTPDLSLHPQTLLAEHGIELNHDTYTFVPTHDSVYPLPVTLLGSNFFDLAHFAKVHGVYIEDYRVITEDTSLAYEFSGKYLPHSLFQHMIFRFFSCTVTSKVFYSRHFLFSTHRLLSSRGRVLVEYYGIFPVTPIDEHSSHVLSVIAVKGRFAKVLPVLIGRRVLDRATRDEFGMLEGMCTTIHNATPNDTLVERYFRFSHREYETFSD